MANDPAPLTRAGLREELDRILQHYATKADLKDLELKLTLRVLAIISVATGGIIAVDRLAT